MHYYHSLELLHCILNPILQKLLLHYWLLSIDIKALDSEYINHYQDPCRYKHFYALQLTYSLNLLTQI